MGCTAEIPQLDRTLNRCVSQIRGQIRLVWLPCQAWDCCSQRQHWTGLKPKLAHKTVPSAWLRIGGLGRWIPGGLASFTTHGANALDVSSHSTYPLCPGKAREAKLGYNA